MRQTNDAILAYRKINPVALVNELKDRLQQVISIFAPPNDPKQKIELCRCGKTEGCGSCRHVLPEVGELGFH